MSRTRPILIPSSDSARPRALELAQDLGLEIGEPGGAPGQLALLVGEKSLGLGRSGDPTAPIEAAFTGAGSRVGGRSSAGPSLVEKALGLPKGVRHLVDATCGLGRDASVLWAALRRRSGASSLVLIEQDPILQRMLRSALEVHFPQGDPRPTLLCGNAVELLRSLDREPEAVLIDPMFEAHRGSALPKRDLQLVQELLGPGDATAARALLEVACETATRRVVVKRGLRDAPILEPVHSVHRGKSLRFDVYAGRGARS